MAFTKNKEVPDDILTQIIRRTDFTDNVDLEDLVDDFATFYIAGKLSVGPLCVRD